MVACQPTVTQQQPWDKVLYRKHPFPDNYSGFFLNELQTNLHIVHYSLWEIVVGACTFMCQVDAIVLYFCVFELVQLGLLPTTRLATATVLLIAGFELLYLAVNRPLSNFRRTIRDHLLTVVTLVFAGYGFTPIIRTLTTSISTDTIYATAIFVFLFSLVFHDFGAAVSIVSVPLSVNLCLAASVFLISRVENDLDAFLLLSLALGLFSFWPQLRNRVFDEVEASPVVLLALLSSLCFVGLFFVAPELIAAIAALHVIVLVFCPVLYSRLQKRKNTINGPWDEATLRFLSS